VFPGGSAGGEDEDFGAVLAVGVQAPQDALGDGLDGEAAQERGVQLVRIGEQSEGAAAVRVEG
jgi:hypothetical protein